MTRRQFKSLQQPSGTPVIEQFRNRKSGRRTFKKLTGGAVVVPPPPIFGEIYRTYYPAAVADYLGISTASWSTGTTGTSGTWTTDQNILYYHFTIASDRTTSVQYITQPLRWTCDIPTIDGDPWDWWTETGDFRNEECGSAATGSGQGLSNTNNIIGLTNGLLPISGDSHVIPPATYADLAPSIPTIYSPPVVDSAYTIPNIESIAAGTLTSLPGNFAVGFYFTVSTYRLRVNGSLLTDYTTAVVAGDVVELDVWYRVQYLKNGGLRRGTPRKFAVYVATSTVATSSRKSANGTGYVTFRNFEMAGINFDPASHTYTLTMSGGSLRFPEGSLGPAKIASARSWNAYISSSYIRWYKDENIGGADLSVGIEEVWLEFRRENVSLILTLTDAAAALYGVQKTIAYTPVSDGNYLASTYARDSAATITHADNGCFNQAGTTTFTLVGWSVQEVVSAPHYWDGGQASGLVGSYAAIPSTITVSRTAQ